MVKDINTQIDSNGNNAYSMLSNTAMTATDNMVIFSADDGIHGKELWKSDGTAAGTALLMDLSPGTSSNGYPKESSIDHMTTTGELAFFYVSSDFGAYKAAFVTDGTPEGTFAVVNSSSHGFIQSMSRFTAIGDQMYFQVNVPNTNLYVSNGTTNGTTAITSFTGNVNSYDGNYRFTIIRSLPATRFSLDHVLECIICMVRLVIHCHEGVELMAYDPVNITLFLILSSIGFVGN